MSQDGCLYHLGCGDTHLDGYVNVDVRETVATDLTADLNVLNLDRPARGLVSHAFFEHLLRNARLPHLIAARRLLGKQGFVCYLGLPDFHAVAAHYLSEAPGVVGPVFDLYNVYRYTHGDPENVDYYFEQLHKSLFDLNEIDRLLTDAGFTSYVIFTYIFPGERVRVSLGFYASADRTPLERLRQETTSFLQEFDGKFLDVKTLQFADGKARSELGARVAASPLRLRLRPFTTRVARRLARV